MRGQVPIAGPTAPAPIALLRLPRTPAQSKGRDVVLAADGTVVAFADTTRRGRQVDVVDPTGQPLGRVVADGRGRWQLLAPWDGGVLAAADTRWGLSVTVGLGPPSKVKGRGEDWTLQWDGGPLLDVRRTPRKVAKRSLDVYVWDAALTPAVVVFVVHVRRWAQAQDATNQVVLMQSQAAAAQAAAAQAAAPPPTY